LRQQADEIERLNLQVLVVTFERDFLVAAYLRETGTPWPILIDRSRELYAAYGMERGRVRDVLGFRSWWAYFRLLLKGRKLHRSEGDIFQLGGDVLIDPGGVVRLYHVGKGPADRPDVSQLLACVRRGTAAGDG
jgi:hypothetical protein